MEYVTILGVKVSKVNYESASKAIEGFLADGGRHYVVTPNPEFIVSAQRDPEFLEILNRADLAIPDGIGLRIAARFLSDPLPQTVTGADLMLNLCGLAAKRGYSVFLLGGREGVAKEAAKRLQERFANLNIVGTYEGDPQTVPPAFRPTPSSTRDGVNSSPRESPPPSLSVPANTNSSDSQGHSPFASTIVSSGAGLQDLPIDLLFVAYGQPAQEKWMARNLSHIPVRVAMGVGGAFDFIAGKKRRAPQALRRLGLEWFWRLVQEPSRRTRIFRATIKFPSLVVWSKIQRCCQKVKISVG